MSCLWILSLLGSSIHSLFVPPAHNGEFQPSWLFCWIDSQVIRGKVTPRDTYFRSCIFKEHILLWFYWFIDGMNQRKKRFVSHIPRPSFLSPFLDDNNHRIVVDIIIVYPLKWDAFRNRLHVTYIRIVPVALQSEPVIKHKEGLWAADETHNISFCTKEMCNFEMG